jgi:DNA-binding NarL/FixJ family response regulator
MPTGQPQALLFLAGQPVPEAYRRRGRQGTLVVLSAAEARGLLSPAQAEAKTTGDVELRLQFERLVALGTPRTEIGRRLGVSSRTVDRWFAALRDRLGVSTASQVVAELARRGSDN